MRRFLKFSAVLAIVILILLAAASIAIRLYFPPERVKAIVVSKVAEALGRRVSVGRADVSLFRGVDIRDIYVGEDQSYGDLPFIRVRRVVVGYSLSEILRRRVVLNRVRIEQPEVHVRSRKGRLAVSDLIKKPPEEKPKKPLPVTVILQRGEVIGFNLHYDAEGMKAALKDINLALEGDIYPFREVNVRASSGGSGNITVSSKGATISSGLLMELRLGLRDASSFSTEGELSLKGMKAGFKNRDLYPFDVAVKLDLAGDLNGGADIKLVSLALGKGNRIDISGSIREMKGLKGIDIGLTGESDLREVSGIAKTFLPVSVSGKFRLDRGEVRGETPDSLNLKAEASLKGVKVSRKGLTVPLDCTVKAEADGKGKIVLSEMRVDSAGAVKVEASATASGWGKGKADGRATILVDNGRVLSLLPKGLSERVGKVEVSGETNIEVAGGRDSEKGPLRVKISGGSVMRGLHAGPVSVQESSAVFTVSSDNLLKGTVFADAGIRVAGGRISRGDFFLEQEGADIKVNASFPGMLKGKAVVRDAGLQAQVEMSGVSLNKGDISIKEEVIRGSISASGDFKSGDISVAKAEVTIPELLKAGVKGEIKGFGREISLDARAEDIDYKKAAARLPSSMRQRLSGVDVEGKGMIAASISGGIKGRADENPLSVSGTFTTKGFGVTLPDKGIAVKDTNGSIAFDLSREVRWLSGSVRVGSIEKSGLLDTPLSALIEFELFTEGQYLRIKNVSAKVPEKGVSLSTSGDIANYIKGPMPDLDLTFTFDSRKKVDLLKGLNASGAATFKGGVRSAKEKESALKGSLRLDHLDISFRDRASVRDLNGEIGVSQVVRYARGVELVTEKRTEPSYVAPLYDLMRPYLKRGYDLTMASASFNDYEVGPLSMDISLKDGSLLVDRYDLSVFGGGMTGRIHASYSEGVPEYSVSSNMAGVRVDRVFKDRKGGEEMEVNADLNLRGRGTDIEGEVNVTKIGKDILDKGLLRLDPNESNPRIVDIRRRLNTLGWVPKEVSLWIRHGELNMDITLQRRGFTLLNIVSLEKIPVRRVPVAYLIKKGMKRED